MVSGAGEEDEFDSVTDISDCYSQGHDNVSTQSDMVVAAGSLHYNFPN